MHKLNFAEAEKIIEYEFKDKALLRQCFTHSSYANENNTQSNERLEFLGDRIVNLAVAHGLFTKFPNLNSGKLTAQLKEIVSKEPLCQSVKRLGLERFLLLGNGESIERFSVKSYSDIFEAIVGGIFLDGGFTKARKFIRKNLKKTVITTENKITLKELVEKDKLGDIEYLTLDKRNSDHEPEFLVALRIGGKEMAQSWGKSVQAAQTHAAKAALAKLVKEQKN